ncbi:hypothetical protein ACWGQ5_51100 [Streptomyces sp. NPDC055722]
MVNDNHHGARTRQPMPDDYTAQEIARFENCEPPWESLDTGVVPLVRALYSLPGIVTISSCEGHPDRDGDKAEWHIGWKLRSADPEASIRDAGPSPEGWLVTEWFMWHAQSMRAAQMGIRRFAHAPAPHVNGPGRAMVFWIYGEATGERALTRIRR